MTHKRSIRHKVFLPKPSFTLAQLLKGWVIISNFTIVLIGSCCGDARSIYYWGEVWSLTDNFEDLSFKGVDIIDFLA